MNKNDFFRNEDVSAFLDWLVAVLPTCVFRLRFSASRFVPCGLDADAAGLESVLGLYAWRASWKDGGATVRSESWETTSQSLGRLRGKLLTAMQNGDEEAMLAACFAVLEWGGVSGARPFLRRKAAEGELLAYLRRIRSALALDADTGLGAIDGKLVERYDAGLTKIHALLDTSGLPIYDSRVGAAVSMLYALYRAEAGAGAPKAFDALRFPSGGARGSQIRNPHALDTRLPAAPQFYTNRVSNVSWAQSQVKLGWIMREVLRRTDWFAHDGADLAARCHAFEAALFMIGYDLRSFVPEPPEAPVARPAPDNAPAARAWTWVPSGHTFSTVFPRYVDYRKALGERGAQYDDAREAGFKEWLGGEGNAGANSTPGNDCFPLRPTEFDLFDRPLDEIVALHESFSTGDLAGIAGFLEDFAIQSDERRNVCLVDVWCVGYLREKGFFGSRLKQVLIDAGFAGTLNSAGTLCQVGANVGRYLRLLDNDRQPTPLFHRYFGDKLADLATQLDRCMATPAEAR